MRVSDNGIIEAKHIPIYSTPLYDQEGGSGVSLGLSVSLVSRNPGDLMNEIIEGRLQPDPALDKNNHEPTESLNPAAPANRNGGRLVSEIENLLVVDDEQEVCNFSATFAKKMGYEVVTANSGRRRWPLGQNQFNVAWWI